MKLTIFGASGRSGLHLVEQALAQGYEVTVLARRPQKLDAYRGRITVVEGDVQDKEAVSRAIAGADAVLSVLGPTQNKPDYEVARGTRNIVEAMQAQGVERLIISAGAGVRDAQDAPGAVDKLINVLLKLFSRHVYEDMLRAVQVVRESDRKWTVVRVPMLTDDPAGGEVRVAYVGKGMGMRVSRADLASFMLSQVESEEYVRQAPAISH